MEEWFGPEGNFMTLLDKAGQLILLNLVWLLACILVIPAGGASVALYYAVIKSVRRGEGDSLQEFFHCFKANFLRGLGAELILLAAAALTYLDLWVLQPGLLKNAVIVVSVVMAFTAVYIFPILSRFRLGIVSAFAMAFTMSIRYLHITLLLLLGTVALVVLQIYILPIYTVLFIPSFWCFGTTYLMEKALRHYMPAKEESDSAWYYE